MDESTVKRVSLLVSWLCLVGVSFAQELRPKEALLCPPATLASLKLELTQKPARELDFFASWCASCKQKLIDAPEGTLFIASFDESEAIETVVKSLRGDKGLRCLWDKDHEIVHHYGVKSLPARRAL